MRYVQVVLWLVLPLVVGCNNESDSEDGTAQDARFVRPEMREVKDTTLELGCATCIYDMPGIEGCVTAAKIDGNPMLVMGPNLDAHKMGLCDGARMAVVSGRIVGENFSIAKVDFK